MIKWLDILSSARKGNPEPPRRVEKSEKEWEEILAPDIFPIARLKGTERAFTGAYCEAHEPGRYACVCCSTPLFDSTLKFDSRSGWPSFTQPIAENVIAYHKDSSYGMVRVEVTCNVCDCHLGHVFPDGPEPSGLRYCINSASIRLVS